MKTKTIKVLAAGRADQVLLAEEALARGEKISVIKVQFPKPVPELSIIGEVVKIEKCVTSNPELKAIMEKKNVRDVTIDLSDNVSGSDVRFIYIFTVDEEGKPVLSQFSNMQAIYSTKHLEAEKFQKDVELAHATDKYVMGTEMKNVPEGEIKNGGVSDIGRGLTDEARMKLFQEQNPHLKEEQTLEEIIVKIFEDRPLGRVISKEEAEGRRRNHPSGSVISHTFWIGDEKKWYFFSDDHCFGLDMLEKVCACSSYLPYKIVAREGFEDGLIKTVDEMIRLHHSNSIYISSLEELVAVLVKYPEFINKKLVTRIAGLM